MVTKAERADGSYLWVFEVGVALQYIVILQARLSVHALLPDEKHVGQVRYVAGGQSQRLDFRQLPIRRFRRDEGAQRRKGRVDAVRAVSLPCVCRLTLFAHSRESADPAPSVTPCGTLGTGGFLRAVAPAVELVGVRGQTLGVVREVLACGGLHGA